MGSNYARLPTDKWNDPDHFDQKINAFSYKEWEPTHANWSTKVDENENEVQDKRKLQEPVLTRWKTVGDAAAEVSESFLPLFFTLQKVINNHVSKVSGLIAALAMSLMTEPKIYSDLCLMTNYTCKKS
jgi:hypothetical protein